MMPFQDSHDIETDAGVYHRDSSKFRGCFWGWLGKDCRLGLHASYCGHINASWFSGVILPYCGVFLAKVCVGVDFGDYQHS